MVFMAFLAGAGAAAFLAAFISFMVSMAFGMVTSNARKEHNTMNNLLITLKFNLLIKTFHVSHRKKIVMDVHVQKRNKWTCKTFGFS